MQTFPAPEVAKRTGGKISLRTVRNAVARHPMVFAALIALSASVAVGVLLFMPLPKNTATVVFQLSDHAPRVISASSENQIDLRTYGNLQAATVKLRQVLSNALKHPEMEKAPLLKQQPTPIDWLATHIQIDFKNGPEFMRVYLEGDQPDELSAILKSVTAAFMAHVEKRDNVDRKKRLVLLEEKKTAKTAEIEVKVQRINVIAQSLKTTDGPTLAIIESLNQDELRTARRELLELNQKFELLNAAAPLPSDGVPPVVPAALIEESLRREPAILLADSKVSAARQVLRDTEARFESGSVNANITRAKADVKAAEENRDKLRVEYRGQAETSIKERVMNDAKTKAALHKEAIEQLDRRRQVSEKQIQEIVARINQHGVYRVEIDTLRKDVSSTEKVLATLNDEMERIRVEDNAGSRVTLAEEVFVQSGVEGIRRTKMMALSSVGVFLAGFAGLIWFEHRGRRVTTADELSQALGISILGTIPAPKPGEPQANRMLVEAVDALRTQLLQSRSLDRPVRTILIASGLSGEGKTTLSGHLAVSLSRAGYRVLLIDGDLHAPTAHRLFGLPPTPGFCEVLRGETDAGEAVRATPVPGMFVMTAGSWNMATRQSLIGDRWGKLNGQLQEEYDFIVVDTAPLLLVADTLLLAKTADAALLSVLIGYSRIGAVGLSQDKLQSVGVRTLGAVVNGAAAAYASDYYGRYKYGASTSADPVPIPLVHA